MADNNNPGTASPYGYYLTEDYHRNYMRKNPAKARQYRAKSSANFLVSLGYTVIDPDGNRHTAPEK